MDYLGKGDDYGIMVYTKNMKKYQVFSKFIIIRNLICTANQHIRMIFVISCDSEVCSNDANNSALITEISYILIYLHKIHVL